MARRDAGFTLIEVAAALAIGAGALVVLLQVFTDGGRRADRAGLERLAILTAESALASAGAQPRLAAGLGWGGVTENGLGWQVAVSDWPGAAGGRPEPLHVVATVRAAAGEGAVLARLATIRLAPLPKRPAEAEDEQRRRGPSRPGLSTPGVSVPGLGGATR
jgi:prepilin-type N-terminal cleavage/methylation domain-containing protein